MVEIGIAYIDPGSGSLIIQVLIASIVAAPIFFRQQIGKLISSIRVPKETVPATDDRPDAG